MFEHSCESNDGKGRIGFMVLGPLFGLLYVILLPIIGVMTVLLALPEIASAKKSPAPNTSGMCVTCHTSKGVVKTFSNREKMSVAVNLAELRGSVHASLGCNDCHQKISMSSHPGRTFDSRRAFAIDAAAACGACHSDEQLRSKPNHAFSVNRQNAPPCTDCHGAHGVQRVADMKKAGNGNSYCLTCHQLNITKVHRNGERLSLHIDPALLGSSVHAQRSCSDCHAAYSRDSHPVVNYESSRDHSIKVSGVCRTCHADKQHAVNESIHFRLMREGNQKAPVCTDCHGFHAVGPKAAYETLNGTPCKKCHAEIFSMYSTSVHGAAKINGGEHKAPLCSSCHFAHDVQAASMAERMKKACLGCHQDAEAAHTKWLPNAGLHLSAVTCASCHSPKANKGIELRLADESTGEPFTEAQLRTILGSDYENLAGMLGAHGEGIGPDQLWGLVARLNQKGTNAKVTFLGTMDVVDGRDAHLLSAKKNAVRECENCHAATSGFFRSVTVAVVKADGRLSRYKAKPEVLGSMFSFAALKHFYVLGSTRLKLLDWFGLAMVLGGISVPVLHMTARFLTSPIREARRLNRLRKEGRR
ncbi:MAG: cytochrome c3 family protein [Thermodesulfovibrionales bacterium]